jgi:hypothetical protein
MTPARYSATVIAGTSAVLLLVAAVNFRVDPAGIYNFSNAESVTPATFAKQLLDSDRGLFYPENFLNKREIKRELALQNDKPVDCALIGSSHVMQISSRRPHAALRKTCKKLLNLGVSGASLEDYLALSWAVLQNPNRSRNVVFGIDPWSLNFNRDTGWIQYRSDYEAMYAAINGGTVEKSREGEMPLLRNLINRDYFQRSVQALISQTHYTIRSAPAFDFATGAEQPVLLPDGSVIYSRTFIDNAKSQPIEIQHYKLISGNWYDERAVLLFGRLVEYLRKHGMDVVFVLTPYHQRLWEHDTITLKAMQIVERRVREAAHQWQVNVLGAYNPAAIGCAPDEFFDFMHPRDTCLAKFE